MGTAGADPPLPPPGTPPPPPGKRRRLDFVRQRGGVLMLVGALLIVAGLGLALAMLLVLLVVQLFANVFAAPFTQEFKWYGPGPLDADPGFRNFVLAATTAGSVLLVIGGVRRYAAEPAPPPA